MTTPRKKTPMNPCEVDESAESEITILPDGRICAFGITRSVAELLATFPMADERMRRRLDRICGLDDQSLRERRDG